MSRLFTAWVGFFVFGAFSASSARAQELVLEHVLVETGTRADNHVQVLAVENPKLASDAWRLSGKVRYEDVRGTGYLEFLNTFSGRGNFFSRTLAESGPMGKLTGSSPWRAFEVPFFSEKGLKPEKIELTIVLPEGGTVELADVRLEEIAHAHGGEAASQNAWWDGATAGRVFGSLGAIVGCIGGLIGFLASKGRARGFVLSLMKLCIALGVAFAAAGIFALVQKQPYDVFYPLLLLGMLMGLVMGGLYRGVKRRYEEAELQRMRTMDTRFSE